MILVSCLRFSLAALIRPYFLCEKKKNHRTPAACFSKVSKLFGPISGATIFFISSQRRGSKPSNFIALLLSLTLKTSEEISLPKRIAV